VRQVGDDDNLVGEIADFAVTDVMINCGQMIKRCNTNSWTRKICADQNHLPALVRATRCSLVEFIFRYEVLLTDSNDPVLRALAMRVCTGAFFELTEEAREFLKTRCVS
jgi:hypothetical protein